VTGADERPRAIGRQHAVRGLVSLRVGGAVVHRGIALRLHLRVERLPRVSGEPADRSAPELVAEGAPRAREALAIRSHLGGARQKRVGEGRGIPAARPERAEVETDDARIAERLDERLAGTRRAERRPLPLEPRRGLLARRRGVFPALGGLVDPLVGVGHLECRVHAPHVERKTEACGDEREGDDGLDHGVLPAPRAAARLVSAPQRWRGW